MTAARRTGVALMMATVVGLLMIPTWRDSLSSLFLRTTIIALSGMAVFSLFEMWPRRLPQWIRRWALQVIAVGVSMPLTTLAFYVLNTPAGAPPFWESPGRFNGWTHLTF